MGVDGQYFTDQPEGWQHHDIDSGVGIEPKKVLINNYVSAHRWIEKSGVGNDVEAEQN